MDTGILTVIGTIFGVIIGFLLNAVYIWIKDTKNEKKLKENVRILIYLELEQNIELLKEYWNNLLGENPKDFIPEYDFYGSLILIPLPLWSHKMWEDQIPFIKLSFNENEIKKIHHLHSKLEKINLIQSKFIISLSESEKNLLLNQTTEYTLYESRLKQKVRVYWNEFEKSITEVLKNGNPIN